MGTRVLEVVERITTEEAGEHDAVVWGPEALVDGDVLRAPVGAEVGLRPKFRTEVDRGEVVGAVVLGGI